MEFSENDNQRMIREMIRDFGDKHIRPKLMEWDESQEFPREVFTELGKLGLMGVLVPESYGGSGFGYFEYVTAITELGKICGSIGLSMAAQNLLAVSGLVLGALPKPIPDRMQCA
jgi:alkylation response protein AidB-like acyl-CoA dehydrogenase